MDTYFGTNQKCPDFRGVWLAHVCTKGLCTLGPQPSVWIIQASSSGHINKIH